MQPGAVISEAWTIYRSHWRHLVSVAVVVYLAITALAVGLAFLIGVFAAFVTLAGVFWLQGVLVKAVDDVRDGRADLSVRETLESALPRINVLSAVAILAAFAIGVGLALLVVPGLVLLTFWSLVVPAIMLEGAGIFRAFGRSRELVRGNAWNVFIVILATFGLLVVTVVLFSLALRAVEPEWVASIVVDIVANSLLAPFVAVAWTLVYYRLRAGAAPA